MYALGLLEPMRRIILSLLALSVLAGLAAQEGHSPAVAYASGFSLNYRQGYKILKVLSPWPGAKDGFTYVLYRRGSPRPRGVSADGFFETPLRRVLVMSTTYLSELVAIGEAGSVIGVDNAGLVFSPEIQARIGSGAAVETTRNGTPNIELMISLRPDAAFCYGLGDEWDLRPKMAEAGLPVVVSGDWNEAEPLARAEWIKFIAAFFDKEELASAYFDSVAAEYASVRSLAASARERPAVLVNGPFQGSWPVSGGRSFMARFIADAGARYLWSDDTNSGAIVLSVEAVYERALKAEIWLNPSLAAKTKADLEGMDPRFASLPAVKSGRVWNDNLRMSPGGGSDYFESAVIHPDKVLTDLVKIFHPGLLADRPLTYYKKIEG
jgi:iron complex transport system substrate-binding protein